MRGTGINARISIYCIYIYIWPAIAQLCRPHDGPLKNVEPQQKYALELYLHYNSMKFEEEKNAINIKYIIISRVIS